MELLNAQEPSLDAHNETFMSVTIFDCHPAIFTLHLKDLFSFGWAGVESF